MSSQSKIEQPSKCHKASGGRLAFHGFTYQMKLLVLFMVHGLTENMSFRIQAERKEAEKFDDIIIIQMNGNDEEFTLVQAKHCASEKKGLIHGRSFIMGCKNDFYLPAYLESFQSIRTNPIFCGENKKIKGLILFTNKDFNYRSRFCDFELRKDIFEVTKLKKGEGNEDGMLQFDLLRFKKDFEGKSFLVSHLKNTLVKIPMTFAECVVNGEVYDLEPDISESYRSALLEEVVDPSKHIFRSTFVEAEGLSPEARHYRDVLMSRSYAKHHGNQNLFRMELKNYRVEVRGMDKCEEAEIISLKRLPEKMARLMKKNWEGKTIQLDRKSLIAKNLTTFKEKVFEKNSAGEVRFRPEFISGINLPASIFKFRESLVHEMEKRQLQFSSIDKFKFDIQVLEEVSTLPSLPCDEIIESFFEKLAFAVAQPNEKELDKLIMEKLLKEFKETEVENVYCRLLRMIMNWMTEREGREFTHEEGRKFLDDFKREMLSSVRFKIRNPSVEFTGREKELNELIEAFGFSNSNPHQETQQSVVIIGIPGVGKTELVKRYVFLYCGEYDNIIWINATNHDMMENSFRELASDKLRFPKNTFYSKSLETIVSEVYDFFREKKNRSLFVFDGAMDLGFMWNDVSEIGKFLPKFPSDCLVHTLITSCYQKWGNMKRIYLETFKEEESIELIKKFMGCEVSTPICEAKELATVLQGYPLALRQALSGIKIHNEELSCLNKEYRISDFLIDFKLMSKECLDCYPESDLYERGTYSTWKFTMEGIQARKGGSLAKIILEMISYFSQDEIPVENILSLFQSEDVHILKQSMQLLEHHSLISIENNVVRIHKFIQMVTRIRLREEELEELVLRYILKNGKDLDAEHSINVWEYCIKHESLMSEFSFFPSCIIEKLAYCSKLERAHQFAIRTVTILEKHLGKKHQSIYDVKEKLAKVLNLQGLFERAFEIYEEVHQHHRLNLGNDHPRAIIAMRNIGLTLCDMRKYNEAPKYFEEILNIQRKKYGRDALETLHAENDIANVHFYLGHYHKASKFYEKYYEALRVSIGEDHMETLHVKYNLAYALECLGQIVKALCLYEEVYNMSTILPKGNIMFTFDTIRSIALILYSLGKFSDSLHRYEKALEFSTSIYGEQHLYTLEIKYNICILHYKLKEYDRALKSLEIVREDFSKFYSENYSKTIRCLFTLASIYFEMGFYRKALHQYQAIYDKLIELGENDLNLILKTKQFIADTLQKLGNLDEALQIYTDICQSMKVQYGEEDSKTILAKIRMAQILSDRGERRKVYEMYVEIYKALRKLHGEMNEDTLTAKHKIACVLKTLNKLHESLVYLKDVQRKQIKVFGEEHTLTKATQKDIDDVLLSILHRKQKTFSESEYSPPFKQEGDELREGKVDETQSEQEQECNNKSCFKFISHLFPKKSVPR